MKKILALLVTACVAASTYAANPFPDISVADVNQLATAKTAVIIDVNGTDSYKAGHVPGALNYEAIEAKFAASLPKAMQDRLRLDDKRLDVIRRTDPPTPSSTPEVKPE